MFGLDHIYKIKNSNSARIKLIFGYDNTTLRAEVFGKIR